jgi:hypothetical protein
MRLFLVFFLLSFKSFSQEPFRLAFNHLTREGGLSNNNITRIQTDSRGFTWITTQIGLNRFDGINVKVYKELNSNLRGKTFKGIVEDRDANLWVGSEQGLNFYDRKTDSFSPIPLPGFKTYSAYPITIDHNHKLWFIISSNKNPGLYIYDLKNKSLKFITEKIHDHLSQFQCAHFKDVENLYSSGPKGVGLVHLRFKNYKLVYSKTYFDGNNGSPLLSNLSDYILAENDSTVWISGSRKLHVLNPKTGIIKSYSDYKDLRPADLLNQMSVYKNHIFIGAIKGVYIFDKTKRAFVQYLKKESLEPNSIQFEWNEVVFTDTLGNLFLGQMGKGVDYTNLGKNIAEHWLKLSELEAYGEKENHFMNIVQAGNKLFAQSRSGKVFQLDIHGKIEKIFPGFFIIMAKENREVWLSDGKYIFIHTPATGKVERLYIKEFSKNFGWNNFATHIKEDEFMFYGDFGFYNYFKNSNKLLNINDLKQRNVYVVNQIFYDKNSNQLFINANWFSKTFVLEKINAKWKITKELNFQSDVLAFMPSKKVNYIWVGTTSGLVSLNTRTFKYSLKTEKQGLPDPAVTDILEEANGDHWLVTNRGIAFFNAKTNRYRSFTSKDGAYANEYGWACAQNLSNGLKVFSGTDGLSAFSKENLKKDQIIPKIQITEVLVNEKPLKNYSNIYETSKLDFKAHQNSFTIKAVGIDYSFPEKVKLRYKLEGYDNQWIETSNPISARYVNVPAGTYNLIIQTINDQDLRNTAQKSIAINVRAPFYKTTWFRLLLLGSILSLGYLLYKIRINQIRNKAKKVEEIRRIKAEAEINALRSQMNPHFIFNCLNTIDSYLLRNKTEEGSAFLNRFSKLIRLILENSRQDLVSLERDISALELYVKLEQERSQNKFSFELNIDPGLELLFVQVPSMLTQPFVENAILHGLRHKTEEKASLQLSYIKEGETLIIKVQDNGIGREAASKMNSTVSIKKESVALKLTQERIHRLNEIYPGKVSLEIIDLIQGEDRGTLVIIQFPLLIQNQI